MPDAIDPSAAVADATVSAGAVIIVLQTWYPNRAPRAIEPGTLDAPNTLRRRLFKLWADQPHWLSLVSVIADAAQDVIDQQEEIKRQRTLAFAVNGELDELGAAVDLPRLGQPDDLYRLAIPARGATTTRRGVSEDFSEIARFLFPDAEIKFVTAFPAGFCLEVSGLSAGEFTMLSTILAKMVPLGVNACLGTTALEAVGPGTIQGAQAYEGSPGSVSGGDAFAVPSCVHASPMV